MSLVGSPERSTVRGQEQAVAGTRASWQLAYLVALYGASTATAVLVVVQAKGFVIVPTAMGSVAALLGFLMLVMDRRTVTIGNILSISVVGGYFVGYLILMLSDLIWLRQSAYLVEPDPGSLLVASLVALVVATISSSIGAKQHPVLSHDLYAVREHQPSILALFVGLGIVGLAIASGATGYMGPASSLGVVPALGVVATLILPPLGLTALYGAATERHWRMRILLLLIFGVVQMAMIPMGRRFLLYSLLLAPVVWYAARGRPPSVWKLGRVSLAIALVLLVGFSVFLAVRQYGYEYQSSRQTVGYVDQTAGGLSLLRNAPDEVVASLGEAVGPRTGSLLVYLGLHVDRLSWGSNLGGQLVLYSAQVAVPRTFLPSKTATLLNDGSSESITHSAMDLPTFDGPNTILTEGFADFGVIGALGYPLLVIGIYSALLALVRPLLGVRTRLFTEIAVLVSAIPLERTMADYFVDCRNLALVAVALIIARVVWRGRPGAIADRSGVYHWTS